MSSAVRVEDLEFGYEREGFSLVVEDLALLAGKRTAIVGQSGSGKTTLLHLMAGILSPHRGRVRVLDTAVSELPDRERRRFRIRRIGLIFQEFELLDHLTVRENVLLPYYVSKALLLDAGVVVEAERVASELGLGGLLDRRPRDLSQGERQRVAVCRALVTRPELILADEPTGNLDPGNTTRLLDLIFGEVEKRGLTFVMVTHDHGLLDRFDEVVDLGERS